MLHFVNSLVTDNYFKTILLQIEIIFSRYVKFEVSLEGGMKSVIVRYLGWLVAP